MQNNTSVSVAGNMKTLFRSFRYTKEATKKVQTVVNFFNDAVIRKVHVAMQRTDV